METQGRGVALSGVRRVTHSAVSQSPCKKVYFRFWKLEGNLDHKYAKKKKFCFLRRDYVEHWFSGSVCGRWSSNMAQDASSLYMLPCSTLTNATQQNWLSDFFWAQAYGDWQKAHPYSQRSFLDTIFWLWECPDSQIHGAFPAELPGRNKYQPAEIWRVTCGPWGGFARSHPDESSVPWKQKKGLVSPHNWEKIHGWLLVMPHVLEVFCTSVDN